MKFKGLSGANKDPFYVNYWRNGKLGLLNWFPPISLIWIYDHFLNQCSGMHTLIIDIRFSLLNLNYSRSWKFVPLYSSLVTRFVRFQHPSSHLPWLREMGYWMNRSSGVDGTPLPSWSYPYFFFESNSLMWMQASLISIVWLLIQLLKKF